MTVRTRIDDIAKRAHELAVRAQPPPRAALDEELAWPGWVDQSVVIAASPRSGSTLLSNALWSTGQVGVPTEYLGSHCLYWGWRDLGVPTPTLEERIRQVVRRTRLRPEWWGMMRIEPGSLDRYVDEVCRRGTGANGVFAIKVHWAQFETVRTQYGFDLTELPGRTRWVHVQRRDLVAQAVSFVRANQTRTFSIPDGSTASQTWARYDGPQIAAAVQRFRRAAAQWPVYFEQIGAEPVPVFYEDLESDVQGTCDRVLAALGLAPTPIAAPRTGRQRDALSDEWAQRFRREYPEFVAPRGPA